LIDEYLSLIEAAPDGIVEIDEGGSILLVNEAAERMFGYPRAELLGQGIEMLVPESRRAAHRERRAAFQKDPSARPMGLGLELEARRKDGSAFPVEISLSALTVRGGRRFAAMVRDISSRVEATRRIFKLERSESAKVARANRLKSEFLANTSHELRTPLQSITGFAELLCEAPEDTLSPKYRRFAGHILRDSRHLTALINDILDFSKIEAGKLDLVRELFPVGDAIAEVMESLAAQVESKRQKVTIAVPPGLAIDADRLRLRAILMNLMSNAIKFTPEKGRIAVTATGSEKLVEVAVSDNGIGIAEEDQAAIFDPFITASRGLREGTGLGLAIARNLVELHGGVLTVESKLGGGSVFSFVIPSRDMSGAKISRPRVVLVVKDQAPGKNLLADAVLACGFQLVLCVSQESAMATASRLQPDVIAVENPQLPAVYSANRRTAHIPVLLILDQKHADSEIFSGTAAVLAQPVSPDSLVEVLRRLSDGV